MTRRTFQKQAALFVAGCALQVCGLLPRVKLLSPELRAIPNPEWETAQYRVDFVWNPEVMKRISVTEDLKMFFREHPEALKMIKGEI